VLVDYLIIGQGLAGSLLAWTLHHLGAAVYVVDDGVPNASHAAAGLINPVVGPRWIIHEGFLRQYASAQALYHELAEHFGQAFYHPLPMWRLLLDDKALRQAQRCAEEPLYHAWLGEYLPASNLAPAISARHGAWRQMGTGYLDTQRLLQTLRGDFARSGRYRQTRVNADELIVGPRVVIWRDVECRHVIFCEGHALRWNPWFRDLPLQPAAGDILTLASAIPVLPAIVHFGHWLIPLAQGGYRLGATFTRDPVAVATPNPAAREQLLQACRKTLPGVAIGSVTEHRAGIRPCTRDKQPFIGAHPRWRNLWVFNGFGSKGSVSIPYYAQRLALHLLHEEPLPPEADIARYYQTVRRQHSTTRL